MSFPLYSVYLLPPTGLAASIDSLREELEERYDCHAARSFMVHCTLKGFFRLDENNTEEQLQQVLEPVIPSFPPFETQPTEISQTSDSIILDLDNARNPRLQDLRNAVYHHLDPEFVHPACPFTHEERRAGFAGHITLAFKDIALGDFAEVLDHARRRAEELGLLRPFPARTITLYRFTTDAAEWQDRYRWWETLRHTALHTWRLRSGCMPAFLQRSRQSKDVRIHYV